MPKPSSTNVQYMRPETRAKWRRLSEINRRPVSEQLDLVADEQLRQAGIDPGTVATEDDPDEDAVQSQ